MHKERTVYYEKTITVDDCIFGGIVQVVAENTLFYDSKQLTCDLITSICQDKDGFIWIGTDYGLNKFNGIQFTHYYNNPKDSTSLSDNSVKALMLDNEAHVMGGRYWRITILCSGRKCISDN